MAFGRSNSLSLNTGATNSLFSQQQQQNPASNTSSLFGNNPQQSQPQQTSNLFGNPATTTPQSQPQQTGGLFGATNTQTQNMSGGTGGLFGNTGGGAAQNMSGGSSLFGGALGGSDNIQKPGVFGASSTNNATTGGTGLFGSTTNIQQQGSLFGGTKPQTATQTGGLFSNAPQPQPSLLSSVQHNAGIQNTPFGRLSMGQSATPQTTVSATNVNLDDLKPTTRFEDCIDQVKETLEQMDKMIQEQEEFARKVEAFVPGHEVKVDSIAPDVDFVKSKAEDVEQALISDAYGVEAQRKNTEKDIKDLERLGRLTQNLALPAAYQYSGNMSLAGSFAQQRPQQSASTKEVEVSNGYDTDLISNYFSPLANDLQTMMKGYADNLSEIESHLKVIESSAVTQAQTLAQRKAGMNGAPQATGDETVRELADTLRGFEESILGVAGVVGECRDGVNELVLGRLGGNLRPGAY
ncbi:hypothetical protein DOTSEDRAFT_90831 [Dothistroma septosporum NZE10]|uniref:Nucleoporin NUP49/NSP49 n=1 Tax=Dothistroma septosporum (strain NZE10 / CBS 128990) TaxID=675120 RepID=N1PF09_DOTSN|nr:hypothetical protein DOTSEDRAFT_90831 [Dothistroma septosporum NZE10]